MKLDKSISAVITGGASGLGAATARRLAADGVRVALFDLNEELGEALAKELGGVFCKVNVTSSPEVDAALAKARAAIGQERILVNCAGVGGSVKTVSRDRQTREIKEYPLDNFERIIQINLIGTFRCIVKSSAGMLKLDPLPDGDRGVIVNTASVAAFDGQVGQAAYSASKGGIVGMTLPIARDLAQHGIRIMTVAPGLFLTPLLKGLPQNVQDSLGAQVPFPSRLGEPSEYAMLVKSILDNPMLNGETIRLDGAIRMAPR